MTPSKGILLANLGTPSSPEVADVRAYLGEFLMDRHVIDLPWLLRKLLVSGFILPFRPKQSAHAYASIWQPDGSPLLLQSQALETALSQQLPATMPVALGMRYGEPSLQQAVAQLAAAGVEQILLVALYPQHADSTRSTCIEAVQAALPAGTTLTVLPAFYNRPEYIDVLAASIRPSLAQPFDHLLLSYHGLPESHLSKADPTGQHCLKREDCCNTPSPAHEFCYRHQVFATSTALTAALDLPADQVTTSFQSRLGRLPWLTPYTDQTLAALPSRGVKRLVVACPAFVADNLETLEEIGIQGRNIFLEAGGEQLTLVPCLNASAAWVKVLHSWVSE